jgi:uncharacterized protein involved in exopolysaccharide biosynthesis
MNKNELMKGDEISFFDLWDRLRSGWRHIIGGTLLGAVGAGLAITVLPSRYEAVAVVQVGQVGQVGQFGQNPSVPVEPVTQAIERMKSPAFQMKVARSTEVQAWADDLLRSEGATTKYITLQIVKATAASGTPLIELRAYGGSAEIARKIAEASIDELAKRQLELAKPAVDKMQLDLNIAKANLSSAEKEVESIHKLMANIVVKDDRFSQLSLMTDLRVKKEVEFFKLRQVISSLESALAVPFTQPAGAIEDIFVTDRQVSPKKALLLALGLTGGFLAGVMSVFLADAWRRFKIRS